MRNYFVKATRHTKQDGSPGSTYYAPVELKNGNLYYLGVEEGYDHDLGFDDVNDAWKVIDAVEAKEAKRRPKASYEDAKACARCASTLNARGYCTDETCPFDRRKQAATFTEG
jgi:hypothetical protein